MIDIMDEGFEIEQEFYLEKLKEIMTELKIEGSLSIKLGTKDESQTLNKQYRQKDYPTDVLSFPFNEEIPEEEGLYLGDIFICQPIAQEQAKENEITPQQELLTLMIHGLLHLSNHDHETDDGQMLTLQDQLTDKYFPPK